MVVPTVHSLVRTHYTFACLDRDAFSGPGLHTIEPTDLVMYEHRPNTCAPVFVSCADDNSGGRARA